jgi:uncharacterized protein YyaL (SSP411 family)
MLWAGAPVNPQYTNALAGETSPYLLQHAHNPVAWQPWGPAAFALARQAGKPIFVSIGYSTCYWCHVMERQCFEDPRIAALMNEHFVCIKVDREERPDVDHVYMTAVQMMTGQGGWPMSVFLTPPGAGGAGASGGEASGGHGLEPFYAGTYFPPEPGHGLPSFPQLLTALADAWRNRRLEVLEQAGQFTAALRQQLTQALPPATPGPDLVRDAANQLAQSYDPDHGGFGDAPKFPQAANLLFLTALHRNNPNPDLWHAVAHTLSAMAQGGVYDQVAGGFHRYATDALWRVPHFEKMLYDSAQLVECYLRAQAVAPDPDDAGLYPRIARETCDYVLREMTDPCGAFWSAQDAEVGGREGASYLWDAAAVAAALGPEDADLAALALKMYGLDAGPNFRDPHHPDAAPANVLFLPVSLAQWARQGGATLEATINLKARIDRRLREVRRTRPQPATDDKVLTAWNGMMIAALALAGRQLREPRYTAAARVAADAILTCLAAAGDGLYHSLCRGSAKVPAFLDDYAFFIHGLIELHRTDPGEKHLAAAERFLAVVERDFAAAGGGYYDTPADQADLLVRPRLAYDGAIPSGNSQMVHDLLDLYELTGRGSYLDRAERDLRAAAGAMGRYGAGMVHMAHALLRALEADARRFLPVEDTSPAVRVALEPAELHFVPPGASTHATAVLHVREGYHIHGPQAGAAGLIPTRVELRGTPGLELSVEYPPPASKRFAFADRELQVYEGTVRIGITLRAAAPATIHAELIVTCQPCTDRVCMEPVTLTIPIRVSM